VNENGELMAVAAHDRMQRLGLQRVHSIDV